MGRMLRTTIAIVGLLLLAWVVTDVALAHARRVPMSNKLRRYIAGAPAIRVGGTELVYAGMVQQEQESLTSTGVSDDGTALFQVKELQGKSLQWGWLYVRGGNHLFFRYQFPQPYPFYFW